MKFLKYLSLFLLLILTNLPAQNKMINLKECIVKEEFIYSTDNKPTPQCHASTIAETKDGLIAAWFGGTEEKALDVGIWISRFENGSWSKPVEAATGLQPDGKRYPLWNPVLFTPKDENLILFYKEGPNPVDWWGMMMTSTDYGKSWNAPQRLPEGFLGPIKNKPVQLTDGTIISPSSTENGGWNIHLEISTDNCKTWIKTEVNKGSSYLVIQPAILQLGRDSLQILCRSQQGHIIQAFSGDNGKSWSPFTETSLPNPNSGIDAVTLKDGRHIVIYNHSGMIPGRWTGNRYPVNAAISTNGRDWKPFLTLDDIAGEFSYPAVIQTADGLVHFTYTYNRQTIKHVVIDPAKIK